MSSPTTPSISTAIEQLRAEIIAPDWQLSPQRLTRLKAALFKLDSFFTNRSHALTLLKMAISVVGHLEQHGNQVNAVDFLKEDLAHIVSLYEDDEYDPVKEKETADRAHKRFLRLNIYLAEDPLASASKVQDAAKLLDALETLVTETAHLPDLLKLSGPLSPDDRNRAASLLGKISAAINITWAHLPPASN
ncbi:MAG: hypothetical protein KKG53_04920 [Proteobacteria bacterium]|nr:hypothetical protein [Pseudomonadota bacterium]